MVICEQKQKQIWKAQFPPSNKETGDEVNVDLFEVDSRHAWTVDDGWRGSQAQAARQRRQVPGRQSSPATAASGTKQKANVMAWTNPSPGDRILESLTLEAQP